MDSTDIGAAFESLSPDLQQWLRRAARRVPEGQTFAAPPWVVDAIPTSWVTFTQIWQFTDDGEPVVVRVPTPEVMAFLLA